MRSNVDGVVGDQSGNAILTLRVFSDSACALTVLCVIVDAVNTTVARTIRKTEDGDDGLGEGPCGYGSCNSDG